MSKLNKKIINIFYALIYQLVIVPLLGFVTYLAYDKIAFLGAVQDSIVLFILLILLLVAINIICVYGVAHIYTKIYKTSLIYYIVVGMASLFIGLWVKVYYVVLENINCVEVGNSMCLDAVKYNKTASTVLIIMVAYYFVYIVLHKMLDKKGNKEGEKKQ